jgi:hypothetical protein
MFRIDTRSQEGGSVVRHHREGFFASLIPIWSRSRFRASSAAHDAPIYGAIEGIIEQSGTPYFSFKDLDENKPSGSIRIRVETIDYFMRRYREDIIKRRALEGDIEAQLAALELTLRSQVREGCEVALAGD